MNDTLGHIKGPQVRAKKAPWGKVIDIAIFTQVVGVKYLAVKQLDIEDINTDDIPVCLKMDPTSAQQLIDDLWDCGLRPSEGSGSAGAMMAVQNHLKDMQRLVFKGKA